MTTNHLEIKMQLGQDVFLNNWRKYCYLEKGLRQKQTGVKLIVLVRFASSVICVLPQSEDKCLYAFCMPPSSMRLPILASVQSFILRCWYSHIHCTCQHGYTNSVLEGKSHSGKLFLSSLHEILSYFRINSYHEWQAHSQFQESKNYLKIYMYSASLMFCVHTRYFLLKSMQVCSNLMKLFFSATFNSKNCHRKI